ncbi:MAG: alpha/beta hydrolase [Symploca sp. SIO3C6]|nr:alpha/beta hydrolase [Symploca sp. SIO3C6]NET03194.1 alpha/beta hydrolase [Symploca sp. SIO2B6]
MPEVKTSPCFLKPGSFNPERPLFVYLPGMDGTGKLLRTQIKNLETAFDLRCLAIPKDNLTSWEELTHLVLNLIAEELQQRRCRSVYLCGESFGGCLALQLALKVPEMFDRIILTNPATSLNHRSGLLWLAQWAHWLPEFFYELCLLPFLSFLSTLDNIAPDDRHALLEAIMSLPVRTVIWRATMLDAFKITPAQLRTFIQPVLVIAGGADKLWPSVLEAQGLVNYLPHAKMLALPESGHACLLETEVDLLKIIKEQGFLR